MCIFTKFSNVFGVSGNGVHSFRMLDAPIIDHIFTILGAMCITYFSKIPLELTIPVCYILGIICHYLFGVSTNTLRYFNISC